jgi:hypothetical protein
MEEGYYCLVLTTVSRWGDAQEGLVVEVVALLLVANSVVERTSEEATLSVMASIRPV